MKIPRIINKSVNYLYYLVKFRNHAVAYHFSHYNLPLKYTKNLRTDKGDLTFQQNNNRVSINSLKCYKGEYIKLVACLTNERFKVVHHDDNGFIVAVDNIQLHVLSASNLVTLHELYLETLYNLYFTKDLVVMDIGMNVGYASLYFSNLPFVKKVYSYEPFLATFKEGLANYELNPALKNKITPTNNGISDYTDEITVPLMTSGDGGASTNKDILSVNGTDALPTTKVHIVNILDELHKIVAENSGCSLLLKIDCEGEEYPILKSLYKNPILEKVEALIIEWHIKGPQEVYDFLIFHGYEYLSLPKPDYTSGMVYAFKK